MYLELAIFYHLLAISSQFERRCPIMKEKDYIRKAKCRIDKSKYHCLAVNSIRLSVYKEECRDPKWVSAGHYPVIRGRYIDYDSCSADYYQSVRYWSNEGYRCTFLKSTCSEIGQVGIDAGNTTTDRTCRCDTSGGYHHVSYPKNPHCSLFLEDCSCYFHPDGMSNKVPTTTYELITPKAERNLTKNTSTSFINTRRSFFKYTLSSLIGVALGLAIVFGVIVILRPEACTAEKLLVTRRKEDPITTIVSQENRTKQAQYSGTQQNEDKQVHTKLLSTNERALLPTNSGFTEYRNKLPIIANNKANQPAATIKEIVILHVEESSEPVITFKKQLAKYLPEGANIVIYDPRPRKEGIPIRMRDILNQCDVLFVFLIRKFSKQSLSENGYDGESIIADLYHRKVITVSGLGINREMKDAYKIKFNYGTTSSKTFKEELNDVLKILQENRK